MSPICGDSGQELSERFWIVTALRKQAKLIKSLFPVV
jgi:hypothetical protein